MTKIRSPTKHDEDEEFEASSNRFNIIELNRIDSSPTVNLCVETSSRKFEDDDDKVDESATHKDNDRFSVNSTFALAAKLSYKTTNDSVEQNDLRPKFPLLKHKPSSLGNSSSSADTPKQKVYPKTPDWFFNIPNSRSPFPDFGTKLPNRECDEEE